MTYNLKIEEKVQDVLEKLAKKDKIQTIAAWKKIKQILENPQAFKPMRNKLKGLWEVHVGSFVLFYKINESTKTVEIYRYAHHDDAFGK